MVKPNKELNEKHANKPIPGDMWHQDWHPVCVVIKVIFDHVLFCRHIKEVDAEHWTWDLDKLECKKTDEFTKWLHFEYDDGYWADVSPNSGDWVLKFLEDHNYGRAS